MVNPLRFLRTRQSRTAAVVREQRVWAQLAASIMPWLSVVLLVLLIAVPIGIFIWLIFFTSLFTVQAVSVLDARSHITEKAHTIVTERIAATPLDHNIFFVDTPDIARELARQIPEIRTVRVTRQLPGTVKVIVQEKKPALLFLAGGQYYFIDEYGIAYERARLDTLPGEVLPIVKSDDQSGQVTLGIAVVNRSFVEFVLFVQKELPQRINAKVAEIRIPSLSAREVRFLLENNWELRFDSTRAPAQQLQILEQLLSGTITPEEQQQLEYVDLRIPDRVYYRTRGAVAPAASPTPPPEKSGA